MTRHVAGHAAISLWGWREALHPRFLSRFPLESGKISLLEPSLRDRRRLPIPCLAACLSGCSLLFPAYPPSASSKCRRFVSRAGARRCAGAGCGGESSSPPPLPTRRLVLPP